VLIGRSDELAALNAALADARLVTLTGLGGIGKTTLARAYFDSGGVGERWFVDLAAISTADEVPGAIAAAVGVVESAASDLRAGIVASLGPSRGLLVLDSFEHVQAAGEFVGELLAAAPSIRVLATSRVRVGLPEEIEAAVGPLPVPGSDAELETAPASALFLRRAGERGRLIEALAPEDRAAVMEVCRRLDGLPLAIELAAGWTSILTPRAIARRLVEQRLELSQDGPPRHASLERVVEATLELVPEADRRVFDALGVFVAPFDEADAAAVAGSSDVLESLRRLGSVALVRARSDADGEPRFSMLETLRAVADRRLRQGARLAPTQARMAAWFGRRSEDAANRFRFHSWSDERAGRELADPNLVASFDAALAVEDATSALQIAASLSTGALRNGILREPAARIRKALALRGGTPGPRADALNALASITREVGDYAAAVPIGDEAVAAGQASGDVIRIVRTLITKANVGPRSEAAPILERAAELGTAGGFDWGAAIALTNLSYEMLDVPDYERAVSLMERARVAYLAAGDEVGATNVLADIADGYAFLGRLEEALHLHRQAYANRAGRGIRFVVASQVGSLAILEAHTGHLDDAYVHLIEAHAVVADVESAAVMADWLDVASKVLAPGHPAAAARALGAFERLHDPEDNARHDMPLAARSLAIVERALGRRRLDAERAAGAALSADALIGQLLALARRSISSGHGRLRGRYGSLTAREQEVLRHLAAGRTDPEIADDLGISPKTASVHVANLKAKLGADTRVEAVLVARDLVGGA
jgi:predicted ATPase/DNA-binding CsgD family transcriptional regulator